MGVHSIALNARLDYCAKRSPRNGTVYVPTDKPLNQGFFLYFVDLYCELGWLVQRCLKRPATRECMRVLNAIIITKNRQRAGVMKHRKSFGWVDASSLSGSRNMVFVQGTK